MNQEDKRIKIAQAIADKKTKQDAIKAKYAAKKKGKAMTIAERVDRIEKLLEELLEIE